jgi:hypothetical protein
LASSSITRLSCGGRATSSGAVKSCGHSGEIASRSNQRTQSVAEMLIRRRSAQIDKA